MATMTEARIQIKLQRLEGFEDQVRVSVLDQGVGVASGKSICVDSEEAARMVGQLYSRGRERGARISLEVATLPKARPSRLRAACSSRGARTLRQLASEPRAPLVGIGLSEEVDSARARAR